MQQDTPGVSHVGHVELVLNEECKAGSAAAIVAWLFLHRLSKLIVRFLILIRLYSFLLVTVLTAAANEERNGRTGEGRERLGSEGEWRKGRKVVRGSGGCKSRN